MCACVCTCEHTSWLHCYVCPCSLWREPGTRKLTRREPRAVFTMYTVHMYTYLINFHYNYLIIKCLYLIVKDMQLGLHSVPDSTVGLKKYFNSIPDGTLHQIGEGLRKKNVGDSAHLLPTQQHDNDPAPVQTPTLSHVPLLFEEDEEVSGRGLIEEEKGLIEDEERLRFLVQFQPFDFFFRNSLMCPLPTLRLVLCPPQQTLSPLSCYPPARRCHSCLLHQTPAATSPVLQVHTYVHMYNCTYAIPVLIMSLS